MRCPECGFDNVQREKIQRLLASIEQLRRDLGHAHAMTDVWMNRARKAEETLAVLDQAGYAVPNGEL